MSAIERNKKFRMGFSAEELAEIYASVGGRIGMLIDGAAINDQRPSEIAAQVSRLRSVQDRIFAAMHEKNTEVSE